MWPLSQTTLFGMIPGMKLPRRRLLLLGLAIVGAGGYLLWPLGSRTWAIAVDEPARRQKESFLTEWTTHAPPPQETAPNVVLILADDLPPSEVGIYGERDLHLTPNIDSIGRDGVVFTDATCTSSICAPSRAALLTGRYQQRFGFELQPHDRYARTRLEYLVFRHIINTSPMVPLRLTEVPRRRDLADQGLPASELTLAELMQSRGYATAAFGKWHLGYDRQFSPLNRGFDEHWGFYEAFSLYASIDDPDVVNTRTDDFSDKHMWSVGRSGASAIVHNDRPVTEDRYLTYAIADRAAGYIDQQAEHGEPFFLYLPFSAPHTPLQAPRDEWDRLAAISNPIHRTYYAMIAALDNAVGTVLAALERNGLTNNTLLIFAGDNGGVTYLGVTDNGERAGGKFTTFQGGLAVPMMIRYPGTVPAGMRFTQMVSLLDVFATVEAATRHAAASTPLPHRSYDGVDLLPHLTGTQSTPPHEALYWRSYYSRAIRFGPWKLMHDGERDQTLLFNLQEDPAEREDLSTVYPEVVDGLLERLAEWERELIDPAWPPVMDFFTDVWGRRFWFAI